MLDWIMGLFAGQQDADEEQSLVLQYFLYGYSTQKVAALTHPGIGGPALIDVQMAVEAEIRDYVDQLMEIIAGLRSEIARGER
jgi:hypothetical protein